MLPLSALPKENLPDLATLHISIMPTLLSDLGLPLVNRYFEIAQKDESIIAFCVLDENHSPVAYVLGSADPAALNKQLRQRLLWFVAQLLKLSLTRPTVLIQLIKTVLAPSSDNLMYIGQVELTYIGVAESVRGKGYAKRLLQAFEQAARKAGFKEIVLSVESDNLNALAVYQKFGFEIVNTFQEGAFHRHRMIYKLN